MNELEKELYSTRTLVFAETSPQSNKYHQIYLDAEEFKKMAFSLGKIMSEKDGTQEVELRWSEKEYDLPDLSEIN